MTATDATIDRLLGYVEEQRAVSFDQIYEYMLRKKLRLCCDESHRRA